MIILTVMYTLIAVELRRTDQMSANQQSTNSKKAVIKMLIAVVVAFFVCWSPFHTQRLMATFIPLSAYNDTLMSINTILFYSSGVLFYINSTINPILYNALSRKYRTAFRRTVYQCVKGKNFDYSETFRSTPHTSVTVYPHTK